MLTGLIFATEEAEHQPGVLAATLPFGGMTLIEYQARLLVAAGAGQLLVAVGRVTPPLAAAVNRIGRRGATVDIVRTAEEAKVKLHPLATIVALADGLVTTDAVIEGMALEPTDTLLVTPNGDATAVERVDADHCWAGVATLSIARLDDAARLPPEYDFQSTLLRVATQARAAHVLLFLSMVMLSAGSLLGWLRGEDEHAAWQERGLEILGVAGVLGIGLVQSLIVQTGTAGVLAVVGVAATILARRLPAVRPPWAATPATVLVLLAPFALAGTSTIGLALVALHAAATLAHAIEIMRQQA